MIYRFGIYSLDIERQELRRNTERVAIEPQVLDLLHCLVRNRARVVSKDDLVNEVWRGRAVSDSTLTSRIAAARRAVGDDGGRQLVIRTLSRKGLRFVAEVEEDRPGRATSEIPPRPVAEPARPAFPDKPSVAVLPFEVPGGDAKAQALADGTSEEIITALSRYPSLFVIARGSSFSFRERPLDLSRIGRDLGVRYLLDGSLRMAAGRVRVTAQLVEAESGIHVWAERYDRTFNDIFAVQDEIALEVTLAIAPAVAGAEQQRAIRRPPGSLDAWTACQRGLWHLGQANPRDDQTAGALFRQAIELDPLFAGGYVGLSAVLSRSKGTQPEEEALARRAVALDGGNAEAHARLALALLARGDHHGAAAEAEQALALCPNLAAAHGALGVILAYSGRPRDGVAALDACLRLDPRGPYLVNRLNQIALAHYFASDYARAVTAANRAIRSFPDFPSPYRWLAAACGQLGLVVDAKAALDKAMAISGAEFAFQVRSRPPWFPPAQHEHMLDGLRKAGWAE